MNLNLFRRAFLLTVTGLLSVMYVPVAEADTETVNDQVARQKEVDNGGRLRQPQRGLNIIRKRSSGEMKTYKIFQK